MPGLYADSSLCATRLPARIRSAPPGPLSRREDTPAPSKWAASEPPGIVVRILLIAGAYFGSAKLGLALAYEQGNVTAVWPPTGIALAALVIWGYRCWPGVALGALLANATTDVPALTTLGIATGNTLEALVGAALLKRFDFRPSLSRVRDVLVLVICAGVVSTMVSATIGNLSLLAGDAIDGDRFAFFWRLWWLGDMGGDLLVAPVLLLVASRSAWPDLTRRRAAEAAALVVLVLVVSWFALSPETPVAFLAFPALVAATLRFRQLGAAVASLLVASVAVAITANGEGPFAGGVKDEDLLASQLFCGVGALTALLLAAVLTERRRVEEAQRLLADTSRRIAGSLDLDETLEGVARAAVPTLADRCVVYRLDEDVLTPVGDAAGAEALDLNGSSAVAGVVRTGRAALHPDEIILPLTARRRTLGGLVLVATDPDRRFDEADLRIAEELADRCALAADNARLYRHQHGVAEALQRSLLPERLPAIAGGELAARYLPGSAGVEVGGDWYDVIQNPRGEVVLVIGDVAGRGVTAASTMGQLRTAARAYALEAHSPATLLTRVNRLAHAGALRDMATALCAVYDPASGRLRIASAGHPPPIVISEDGAVRSLGASVSLPLNVDASAVFSETEEEFGAGSTLLLYTDGLIERRGVAISEGVRDLELALEHAPAGAEALCGFVAARALSAGERSDDVALLAFRVVSLRGEQLDLRVPARPEVMTEVRRSLGQWLTQNGAGQEEVGAVVLACSEACANAVEHAYGPVDAELVVSAIVDDGVVTVSIRDFGSWREPRGEHRGRGLLIMRELMDDVAVTKEDEGSTVRLSRRLANPAESQPDRPVARTPSPIQTHVARSAIDGRIQGDAAVDLSRDGDIVVAAVVGEVDLANAKSVFARVAAALDNRATALLVDLSATRYLDSSGLQALLELRRRTQDRGQEMRIIAPPGSPPRRLIELVSAQDTLPLFDALAEARG